MPWSLHAPSSPPSEAETPIRVTEEAAEAGANLRRGSWDTSLRWPERRYAILRALEAEPERRPRRAPRSRAPFWRTPVRVIAALVMVQFLAFNLSVVRGSSMTPGIHDGDRILIDQVSYLFSSVDRGDVVVLRYPLDPRLDYIKRVVGLPGDRVTIHGGCVAVNGRVLEEPYVSRPDRSASIDVVVRTGHYFVLGDNRPHSSDSREFGQVPTEFLRGKVDVRVWPPARIGWIH